MSGGFWGEGTKAVGYEMAGRGGGGARRHIVVPMAGGSLIGKVQKAFGELARIGLIADPACKIYGAQATGCSPISSAVKNGSDTPRPVPKPTTIPKSLPLAAPAASSLPITL